MEMEYVVTNYTTNEVRVLKSVLDVNLLVRQMQSETYYPEITVNKVKKI